MQAFPSKRMVSRFTQFETAKPDLEPFPANGFSELGTPGSLNLELSGVRVTEFGTFGSDSCVVLRDP